MQTMPIVWLTDYNMSYCILSKTGSTTWTHRLLDLAGINENYTSNYDEEKRQDFVHQLVRGAKKGSFSYEVNEIMFVI